MGLVVAAKSAISSTLHDQWKDIISCENMNNEVLMKAVTSETGAISKKSIIRVMPGQCAIIMQNGKVLDATAEEGDYIYDESTSPSFFAGNFGAVFKEMWTRFTYGGNVTNQQTVFYFNTKEIIDNKFGTANPVPYQDWSHPVPNQMTGGMIPLAVKVKCFGKYTFKIVDPSLFMREIAGTASVYTKAQINEQIRTEVMSVFQNLLNELGTEKYKVPVLELQSQTDEIKEMMDARVFDETLRRRGIAIVVFAVENVIPDEKSDEYIRSYTLSANASMQQGTLVDAYAAAVKDAANNANGAANGFMGIGMMNMAGGGMFGATTQNAYQGAQANIQATQNTQNQAYVNNQNQQNNNIVSQENVNQEAQPENMQNSNEQEKAQSNEIQVNETSNAEWKCPNCGSTNTGKFCTECGAQKKVENKCPKCGNVVAEGAKFCAECGEKLQ